MQHPFFAPSTPRLFAHRGDSGLAPENTMEAFQRAVDAGVQYIETDVHGTSDGHIVIHHDHTLERTTNGTGDVKTHTLAQLQALDAGYAFTMDGGESYPYRETHVRIPLLRDAFDAFRNVRFNIEVKQADPPLFHDVIACIKDAGRLDDVLIACEGDVVRDQLDSIDHGMPRNAAGSEVLDFIQRVHTRQWDGFAPRFQAFEVPVDYDGFPVLTPEFLAAAHEHDIECHVWTINTTAEMRRLLDMGVDGVMSDFPATLLEVAATRD